MHTLWTAISALAFAAGTATGAVTHTIFFDGAEPGISPGFSNFSFEGANFFTGQVMDFGSPALRASGAFGWLPQSGFAGNAFITFDQPVDGVEFFYVHDFDFAGDARADFFDADGTLLGSVFSNPITFPGDPANFESFASAAGISKITFSPLSGFSGLGYVDNFSFTTVPAPTALPLVGMTGVVAVRRRRR